MAVLQHITNVDSFRNVVLRNKSRLMPAITGISQNKGRLVGGYQGMQDELDKLAKQIDDRDRQYIPKLNSDGFYF